MRSRTPGACAERLQVGFGAITPNSMCWECEEPKNKEWGGTLWVLLMPQFQSPHQIIDMFVYHPGTLLGVLAEPLSWL